MSWSTDELRRNAGGVLWLVAACVASMVFVLGQLVFFAWLGGMTAVGIALGVEFVAYFVWLLGYKP
jgi:hypothetical protein